MAKRKRRPRADHPRRPTITRREVPAAPGPEDQALFRMFKQALYADHPVALLEAVSAVVSLTEPPPGGGREDARVSLATLVESLAEFDLAPTTAALHVLAAYLGDDELADVVRRVVAHRSQPVPLWLGELGDTRVDEVLELRHVLRDGEDYFLGVRLPSGHEMTALVYVDNNLGGVVKDAMVSPHPLSSMRANGPLAELDDDIVLAPFDPRAARALVERAVDHGAMVYPPLETDTWPACRPLVRWLLRLLPPGGAAPEWREWSDRERDEIAERFLASRYGEAYGGPERRALLDQLLWFGTSYGTCDPLRWTPVNVEILLVDWAPRKVDGDLDELARLPGLLRAFIRYSHAERGLRQALTDEVLDAVTRWEGEYRRLVADPDRPRGAEALARMLIDGPASWADAGGVDGWDDEIDPSLVDAVGSLEALASLDVEPLPDEDFDWEGIADDIRRKVGEILHLCDENATELLDVEHRTANRRLLRRLALTEPQFFRGRAGARTSAAAVSWMIAHANNSISAYGPLTSGELLESFGVRSASQRASQFRAMLGMPDHVPVEPMPLGTPDLLTGDRRLEILREVAGLV